MTYKRYSGEITNRDDPEMNGRVKVKCPALLDEDQELPNWIRPKFNYVGKNGGWFGIPELGSEVDLLVPIDSRWDETPFEQSLSIDNILWECTAYNDVQQLDAAFKTNYPDRVGYFSPGGWCIYFDSNSNECAIGYIPDGEVKATVKIAQKSIEINIEDTFKIKLDAIAQTGLMDVAGQKIDLNTSGITLTGTQIALGGTSAIDFLMKGTTVLTAFTAYFTAILTAAQTLGSGSGSPVEVIAYGNTIAAAIAAIQATLATWLSTISKTL